MDTPRHQSTLANHPDVREVLPIFIARLRNHVRDMRRLLAAGELEKLRVLVHQLRGAGASFGFAPLTQLAAGVEEAILQGVTARDLQPVVEALVAYIEKIEGY